MPTALPVGLKATVTVPGSSANLGPGFDTLGIALGIYDTVEVETIASGLEIEIFGEGADDLPRDSSHLVVKAINSGFEAAGVEAPGLRVVCHNEIPQSRGLGSSASAAVAGVVAANALAGDPLDSAAVVQLSSAFEGHPDNVAPAVFGGATVAWVERGGRPRMAPMPVDASLGVSLLIPPATTRLSTKEARQVLPVSVPREDALFNTSRAAVLMLALAGRPDLLMAGTEDRLHQEYRRGVLPASMAVMDSLREQGYPAVISGAGPTVLVLSTLADQTRFALENHGWSVLSPGIDTRGAVLTS